MVLAGALFCSCLLIFWDYLFGQRYLAFKDIGSDIYNQYLMYYQTIINHLREGSFSLWDFNNGFGINMYSYTLFDPFVLIVCLFGAVAGPEQIYGLMVWVQILKIILAGLAVYGFLSCFELSEKSKLFAAYAYGLCGYMVVWGQHYNFGTIVILFPLLLMSAEKARKRGIWLLGLTITCAVSCFSSLYFSYMQFLVLGFYVLFRTAWENRIFCRDSLKQIGKIYGSMILGIGMGLFQLLPSACFIMGVSGRVSGGSAIDRFLGALRLYDLQYYITFAKRLLSSNLVGINQYLGYQNYYEDPNVFLSALFLLTGVQFFYFVSKKKYSVKQKMILGLALASCVFVLFIPAGSLIFNGFSYPFSRETFLCMPFFVWIMAYALQEILEKKRISVPLLIFSILSVLYMYSRMFQREQGKLAVCLAILALVMAAGLAAAVYLKGKFKNLSIGVLALALIGTMILDGWYSYNVGRVTLRKDSTEYFSEMYSESVQAALSYLEETDDSFYRVEKDYAIDVPHSTLNSLAQNYQGVSTYNSTLNTNIYDFIQKFWPGLQVIDKNHYGFANASNDTFPASLSHVKYVLSKNSEFDVQGYEFVKQFDDIYLYRNTCTEDLGKFYTSAFTAEDYELYADSLNKEKLLSENVICDTVAEITRDAQALASYVEHEVTEGAENAEDTENISQAIDLTGLSRGIFFEACEKDSVVSGTASVSENGILMLAIPYENGWHAYVDGEEQEIHQVNYGFSGIYLENGDHGIRMVFKCPGFAAGIAGSVVFTVLTAAIWIVVLAKKRL